MDNKGKVILIVDDDEFTREPVIDYLIEDGYRVLEAADGEEGWHLFKSEKPDLVVLDLRMPKMDGLQVLALIKEAHHLTPVIVISGQGTIGDAVKALKLGAWDYIPKPITEIGVLEHGIERALERADLLEQKEKYSVYLEEEVKRRTSELAEVVDSLETALSGTIEVVASIVEHRDPYTSGHQKRVASLAQAIGEMMQLDTEEIEGIYTAGMVHDLGKISVPSELLSKPGKIDKIEFQLIQRHSQGGYDILKGIEFQWPIADMILQHHERIDGSGYPNQLKGDEILLGSRIICVADVVEAMASHRPYRAALGVDAALEHIVDKRGVFFDEDAVNACVKVFDEGDFTFEY